MRRAGGPATPKNPPEPVDDAVESRAEFITLGMGDDRVTTIHGQDDLDALGPLDFGENDLGPRDTGVVLRESFHLLRRAFFEGVADVTVACRDLCSQWSPPI